MPWSGEKVKKIFLVMMMMMVMMASSSPSSSSPSPPPSSPKKIQFFFSRNEICMPWSGEKVKKKFLDDGDDDDNDDGDDDDDDDDDAIALQNNCWPIFFTIFRLYLYLYLCIFVFVPKSLNWWWIMFPCNTMTASNFGAPLVFSMYIFNRSALQGPLDFTAIFKRKTHRHLLYHLMMMMHFCIFAFFVFLYFLYFLYFFNKNWKLCKSNPIALVQTNDRIHLRSKWCVFGNRSYRCF